jgi:hypothetical protein
VKKNYSDVVYYNTQASETKVAFKGHANTSSDLLKAFEDGSIFLDTERERRLEDSDNRILRNGPLMYWLLLNDNSVYTILFSVIFTDPRVSTRLGEVQTVIPPKICTAMLA